MITLYVPTVPGRALPKYKEIKYKFSMELQSLNNTIMLDIRPGTETTDLFGKIFMHLEHFNKVVVFEKKCDQPMTEMNKRQREAFDFMLLVC